jgi:hypothetical protein
VVRRTARVDTGWVRSDPWLVMLPAVVMVVATSSGSVELAPTMRSRHMGLPWVRTARCSMVPP